MVMLGGGTTPTVSVVLLATGVTGVNVNGIGEKASRLEVVGGDVNVNGTDIVPRPKTLRRGVGRSGSDQRRRFSTL